MTSVPLKVRACAFDAYGTLFDFNTVHRCADELGDKAGPLRDLWRAKQLQYFWQRNMQGTYKRYEAVTEEALDYALQALQINVTGLKRKLLSLYADFRPYPEVAGALKALRAAGIHLAIHTNASVDLTMQSITSAGFDGLFDRIISIEPLAIYKPDPRAYGFLLSELDMSVEDVCFVSSNGWDTHGAAHFGLPVAWINRAGTPDEPLPGRVRFELRDLGELPPLLRAA